MTLSSILKKLVLVLKRVHGFDQPCYFCVRLLIEMLESNTGCCPLTQHRPSFYLPSPLPVNCLRSLLLLCQHLGNIMQDGVQVQGGAGQYSDCDKERAVRHAHRQGPPRGRYRGGALHCRPGQRW